MKDTTMLTLPINNTVILPNGGKLAGSPPPPNARADLKVGDPEWPGATYGELIYTLLMDVPTPSAADRAKQYRMARRMLTNSDKLHLRADKVQELLDYISKLSSDSNFAHPGWQGAAIVWLEEHLEMGPPADDPW